MPYADNPRCRDPVVSTDNRRPRVSRARHATPEWPPPTSRAWARRGYLSTDHSSSSSSGDLGPHKKRTPISRVPRPTSTRGHESIRFFHTESKSAKLRNRGRHPRVGSEKISRGFEISSRDETTSKVRENRPKGRTATDTFPRTSAARTTFAHSFGARCVTASTATLARTRVTPTRGRILRSIYFGCAPDTTAPPRPASSHRARRFGGCSVRNGNKSHVSFRALFRNPAARHLPPPRRDSRPARRL